MLNIEPPRSRWLATALIGLTFAGCEAPNPSTPELKVASVRDSSGVRIVESPEIALTTPLNWIVDSVPDLQVGSLDGAGPDVFSRIVGVVPLEDGGFVVGDRSSAELRWFDRTGASTATYGRAGQGPGEFQSLSLIPSPGRDSLVVFDTRRRDFTLVAPDASGFRVITPPARQLVVGAAQGVAGDRAVFRSGSLPQCPDDRWCDSSANVRSVRLDTIGADTLGVFPRMWIRYFDRDVPIGETGALDPAGAVAPTSQALIVEGHPTFELRRFDLEGTLTDIYRVNVSDPPPASSQMQRYIESLPNGSEARRVHQSAPVPEDAPSFARLIVDSDGWVWALLFEPANRLPTRWLVFDPGGNAAGYVDLPDGLDVEAIGRDYILGVWEDDFRVEYVRRYQLARQRNAESSANQAYLAWTTGESR